MPQNRWLPILTLLLAAAVLPHTAQAQLNTFNFCTIFEEVPQTEGVRSALFEEWNSSNSSWASNQRWVISYQDGNPTEYLFQERDQTGAWADTARAQGIYDGADRITRCTYQFRDAGMYINAFRSNFSYDANDRLTEEVVQSWDTTAASPNGTWINSGRYTYSYNAADSVTQQLSENWDPDAEVWREARRIQNTYNASNRLTEQLEQQSDGSGGWINSERTQKTYGNNGITETVYQIWDSSSQTWENDTRSQFSYPDSDTEVEVVQTWSGSNWINDERTTRDLNADGFAVNEVIEVWTGSMWVNDSRTQNTFATVNGAQKFKQALDQTWISSSGMWENDSRTTLSYTGVIPVELASFGVWKDGTEAVLRWETASETNNAGFELQHRPSDKDAWQKRAFIESATPGGTTSEPQTYRFRTLSLPVGTHAFRLRQVDLDGTPTLTDPVFVTVAAQQPLRLTAPSPNPASAQTSFSFAVDDDHRRVEVALFNVLGQRVRTVKKGAVSPDEEHTVDLNTNALTSGQYVLRFKAGDHVETRIVTVVR